MPTMTTSAPNEEAPVRTARPRLRWRRLLVRLGWTALGIVVIFWGLHQFDSWQAFRELQEAVEEVNRRDPAWRLEELEEKRSVVPDAENGALVVLTIARLLPKGWASKPIYEALEAIPPAAQLHPRHLEALRAELKTLAPAVAEARKLVAYSRGRFPITWEDSFLDTLTPHWQDTHYAIHLLDADARLRSQDGDADGALTCCRAILNAGRMLGDEPMLTTQLVRIACRGVAPASAERALAQGETSAKALAELQQSLEKEASESLMRTGLRGERAGFHHLLTNLENGKILLSRLAGRKKTASAWDRIESWFSRSTFVVAHIWILRNLTDMIEALDLPDAEREARLQKLQARVDKAPTVAALLFPVVQKVIDAEKRSVAGLRCAVAGVAAERYRRKTGSWPKRLEDLVSAGLLKEVPSDPFDGKPLRLRHAQDGMVIYSIGPEGKGDGTSLDDGRFDPNEVRVEFRLWDVARRRQPPRPIPPETLEFPQEEPEDEGP
jgi:hypothetical protein